MQKKKSKESKELFIKFVNDPTPFSSGQFIKPTNSWSERFSKKRLYDISRIPEARVKLQNLLDQIIENQGVSDSEDLQYFIRIRDKYVQKYVVKNGKLTKTWVVGTLPIEVFFHPIWLRDLSFSIIKFLTGPEKEIRKLKKCRLCEHYFKSTKEDNRIKYCRKCSPKSKLTKERKTELQRKRRARERELRVNRTKEEQMRRFLEAGFTQKEAEKQWEAYKRENKL